MNSLKPPSAPERPSSPSSPRRSGSRRPSVAPPAANAGPPTVGTAAGNGANVTDAAEEVASKAEEAVNQFTITASKASTVFTIDLAELRRMRIKQGKTPGISEYSRKQKVSRTSFLILARSFNASCSLNMNRRLVATFSAYILNVLNSRKLSGLGVS